MKLVFKVFLISFGLFVLHLTIQAQAPVAGFTLPAQACLTQNITPLNTSSSAISYEWDFCQGDLGLSPTGTNLGTVGGSITTGVDVVFDGQNWFGFVASRETNSLIRLDFGSDFTNTPTITDLGNVSGVMGRPIDIRIIKDGGNWYGFVYSDGTPGITMISRINFGNSLQNTTASPTPITADVVTTGTGAVNGGFDMIEVGSQWFIVYTQPSTVGIIRLNTIAAIPTGADKILSAPVSGANGATSLGDIKILSSNGQRHAYTVDFGNKTLHRLDFGSNIFSTPTDSNITGSLIGSLTPYGIDGGFDNGSYYLFVITLEGSLLRINLGSDLTTSPISGQSIGNAGVLTNTLKIRLVKFQSQWVAFSLAYDSDRLFRVAFPNPVCSVTPFFSTLQQPVVEFNSAGQQFVTLHSFNSDGNFDEANASINVLSAQAPPLDFQYQNMCAQNPVSFSYQSTQTLIGWQWDFGNGDTSAQPSPTETFNTAGSFTVSFMATDNSNGCKNTIIKPVTIYHAPISDFAIPTPALVCTNQNYSFLNTSTFDSGSTPSWQWNVNGSPVSTTKDLVYAFGTTTSQQIDLIAKIPGCSAGESRNFVVQQSGPSIDFTPNGNCQGTPVQFTNTSTGTITGYTWTFGDGNTSHALGNTQNTYSATGKYTVMLVASDPSGCNNSSTQQVTIYSTPVPDFTIQPPPFSCNGAPSYFNDNTPPPSDSNLSWTWSFGDLANGSSTQQNPDYTYVNSGVYPVTLLVNTEFGCSAMIQKSVTIAASPVADFTNGPACVDQGAHFTDISGPDVVSKVWQIGTSTFTSDTPVYVFTRSGSYPVHLAVTAGNNCIAQVTKNIVVPVPQVPDFSSQSTCAGKTSLFQDATPGGSDPAVSWTWDFAGQGTGSGSSTQHVFPNTGNFSVTMMDTAQSGCVYSVTKSITIAVAPQASFTTSVDAGAAPLIVQFTNTSSNATSYMWNFNDDANSSSNQTSPPFTFAALGDYVVDLTAFGVQGCQDTHSKIIRVVVPEADVFLNQLQFIHDSSTGQLQALFFIGNKGNLPVYNPAVVLDIAGTTSIKENLALTLQPGQTVSQVLNYSLSSAGLSYVCLSVDEPGDVDLFDNKECAALADENVIFAPYPNPVSGELHFDWIAVAEGTAEIVIFNATGEKAFDRQLSASAAGLNQIQLDVSNLRSGVYLAVFKYLNGQKTFRFIVN